MAYQRPSNPAPVSGPGALSQRTDGGPADKQSPMVAPGGAYGDRADMMDLQSSAPMEAATTPAPASVPAVSAVPQMPVPFTDPSKRPYEPVTTGVAAGPGAGPEILGLNQPPQYRSLTNVLQAMLSSDTSGEVAAFLDVAQRNGW
jgi:hypothetical protein